MEQIQALLGSDRPWAQQRAQLAIDILAQYQSQQISHDEYQELLQDLVRTDVLDSEADDIETKTMLISGVNAMLMII